MLMMLRECTVVTLYYSVESEDGYGSVSWHLSETDRTKYDESVSKIVGTVVGEGTAETFVGSDIYQKALANREEWCTE
jgi:hypothetical protein